MEIIKSIKPAKKKPKTKVKIRIKKVLVKEMPKIGRPIKIDKDKVQKLEFAFAIGCTDIEAYTHAEIPHSTFYKYQSENPDFLDKKNKLRDLPILKAKQTIINDLWRAESAKWYLERKCKAEFSIRSEVSSEINHKINNESFKLEIITKNADK